MQSRFAIVVATIGVAAAALAAWLFPRALPIVALEQSLTRDVALARADSFFRAHSLAPTGARTAVQFQGDDSLRTFVELAGGGPDSLNALVRGDDVAPFTWSVRAFLPGNPREARVDFAPDGRIIGFERKLAEADKRPTVSPDSGRRLAEQVLDRWIDDRADGWKLATSSYETIKTSGRVDRSYIFERTDRRIGGAPIRAEAVIAGDTPALLRPYVEVPESFRRRYAEMRSWNDLLARLAMLGILGITVAGAFALARYARQRRVRWRQPMLVGAVIGALMLAAALNEMPGSWFSYDTAMPPATFLAIQVVLAMVIGVTTALLAAFTLAAAEAATRHAFPRHLDWWKLWRYRGTREVAGQVGGGYAVAAIALAYVAVFYLVTRTLFGWWVPAQLLDDPNQIASPMPWISGIAMSLNAAVWEEALFRALPLSLLSLWIGQRPNRRWWMAAGVVLSALVFGFAHANYESWPPYSRGVEIFLDACFWAVLFLRFGLLVTVVAHFGYDAVLFGIFAAAGDATEYRVTAAIILVALLAPALVVLWRRAREGGFTPAPDEARFAAWTPLAGYEPAQMGRAREAGVFTRRGRRLALAAAVAGLVVAVGRLPGPALGPEFTAPRGRVLEVADSMLRARGGDPAGWTRLATIENDEQDEWPRFVQQKKVVPEAERLASSHVPPTWWIVRYVHTSGSAAERTEEWRVRLWPDGRPLDARHFLPDSVRRDTADAATVRRLALASLARDGIDPSTLQETEYRETPRPARRDVTVTYTDTAVKLPDGAAARAWVRIAGDQPLGVRRGVELPEAFLRADRSQQATRMIIGGVSILLLLGLLIAGAILVKRRLPAAVHDGPLNSRRVSVRLLGGLILLGVLSELNSLPSQLFSYDTAEPWSTFLGTTALGFVTPVILAVMLVGLVLVLDALRRRVGIPMLPDEPSRSARSDMLIAGLGLGGIAFATADLDALIPRDGMPRTPWSALDQAVPVLAGIPGIPASAIVVMAMFGIPILVVAGLTARRGSRALMAGVVVTLVAAIAWSFTPTGDVDPAGLALTIASIVLMVVAIVVWGALAAWAWVVAALSYQAFGGLRHLVYGPEWQTQAAGAVTILVAIVLIALIVRHAPPKSLHPGPSG